MSEMRRADNNYRPLEPEGWVISGFEDICFYGDWIQPDDVIRYVGFRDAFNWWEHKECAEAGEAVVREKRWDPERNAGTTATD